MRLFPVKADAIEEPQITIFILTVFIKYAS